MKLYHYWQIENEKFFIEGNELNIKCYGGSNLSDEDARLRAREKIEKVKRKIAGEKHVFETYEVEIREEIVQAINEKAVITRNRYGAQVLNIEDVMIMDIDKPKRSFGDLFKKPDQARDKQRIIEMVQKRSKKVDYQGLGFRVYETHKGIRVIVLGKAINPTSRQADVMMKEFHCDNLYRILCRKQACYRARLTPKASRMNLRGHRVRVPRSVEEEQAFQEWLLKYEAASSNYSVCKFVEQIGDGYLPEAIRVHDEICGVHRNQKLA